MGAESKIEWTDATWNPVTGCTKVSEGCRNCYMARTVPRFGQDPWTVVLHPDRLEQPLRWKRPRRIFVNSLSDLFHEDVPDRFIDRVFAVMGLAHRHIFQVLTKRPERMRTYMPTRARHEPVIDAMNEIGRVGAVALRWPLPNVWLGVSVENQETADERIPLLLQTPAALRFLSAEPLLGPINIRTFDYAWRIKWVIAGGESGPDARPTNPDWIRSIRDQCAGAEVPFFFKQWGEWAPPTGPIKKYVEPIGYPKRCSTLKYWMDDRCYVAHAFRALSDTGTVLRVGKKAAGAMLDGREHKEWPR